MTVTKRATLSLLLLLAFARTAESTCKTVTPVAGLNVTEFVRATWFSQKQQITGYQQRSQLYCVAATYDIQKNRTVPFFGGTVVTVYNWAQNGSVAGAPENPGYKQKLCARVPDAKVTGKILVAPCFLPNFLAGPYWVVAKGDNTDGVTYDWIIVSGGQPTVQLSDGCTTKETGVNNSGLWFFTRAKVASAATLAEMDAVAKSLGYSLQELLPVGQLGCTYADAFIKA